MGLTIIFVAGILVGASLSVIVCSEPWPRPRRTLEQTRDALTERIADRLELSPAQTEQLRGVVEDRLTAIRQLRSQIQPQAQRQGELLRDNVAALLDERQRAKWAELYGVLSQKWFAEPASTQPATQRQAPAAR